MATIIQSFILAIRSILSNKMRSFLTMLGIIIGVAAVIILVSVVSGYMGSVISQFEEMGVNRITVNCRYTKTRAVTDTDMYSFLDENYEKVDKLSPVVTVSAKVKYANETMDSTAVKGVSEDYAKIMSYKMEHGRDLTYADVAGRASVCIMGYYVLYELFGGDAEKAIGASLKINGYPYEVVGIVEPQDDVKDMDDGGTDDFVWLPYTNAVKLARNGNITNFVFTSTDVEHTEEIRTLLTEKLVQIYKSSDYFNIMANSSIITELNKQVGMISGLLGGIAGISLLVAGIGVMNIMLVSVTERTKEIGIRKALGAKQGVIMQQFVIEASLTSVIGGIIGIIIGGCFTTVVGKAIGVDCYPTIGSILLSVCVSVAIGVLFGYLPAKRAAKLNPIDALRAE